MWSRNRETGRSSRYTEKLTHFSEREVDQPADTETSEMEFRLRVGVLLVTGVVLVLLGVWLSGNVLRFLAFLLLVTAVVGSLVGAFWAAEHPAQAGVVWGQVRSRLSGR